MPRVPDLQKDLGVGAKQPHKQHVSQIKGHCSLETNFNHWSGILGGSLRHVYLQKSMHVLLCLIELLCLRVVSDINSIHGLFCNTRFQSCLEHIPHSHINHNTPSSDHQVVEKHGQFPIFHLV